MKHFFLLHFLINSNNELPQQSRFLLWLRMRPNAASPRSLKVPTNNKSVGHQKAQLYIYQYHFRDILSHLFLGPYDLNSTLNVDHLNWTLTTFFICITFFKKGKTCIIFRQGPIQPYTTFVRSGSLDGEFLRGYLGHDHLNREVHITHQVWSLHFCLLNQLYYLDIFHKYF